MITSFQSHLAYVLKLYKVVLIPESSDDVKIPTELKDKKKFDSNALYLFIQCIKIYNFYLLLLFV